MPEHRPDPELLPNADPVPEDPTKTKIFVSQEERDVNLDAARETLRIARIDLAAAKTPEAIAAATQKIAAAEAHFNRMNKGTVAGNAYPRYQSGK